MAEETKLFLSAVLDIGIVATITFAACYLVLLAIMWYIDRYAPYAYENEEEGFVVTHDPRKDKKD